jgi:hypothetical protein
MRTPVQLTVYKTDNGFVLEWRDDGKRDISKISSAPWMYNHEGVEVLTEIDKLLERIKAILK